MAEMIMTLIPVSFLYYYTWINLGRIENKIDKIIDNLTTFEEREK